MEKTYNAEISKDQIESLARCLLPEIRRFFDSAEGKREFIAWQAEQVKLTDNKNVKGLVMK